MSIVKKGFGPIYSMLFAIFVLFGTSMTIVGAILPRIFTDFGWTYVEAGILLASGAIGMFVATFLGGRFLHLLGIKALLVLGVALQAMGLAFFGSTSSLAVNIFLYAAIGLGQGCIEVGTDWSVVRMSPEKDGRAMNLAHGAFSIGAVVGPLLMAVVLASGLAWNLTFKIVAIVYGLILVALLALPLGRLGREEGGEGARLGGLAANPAWWLGFLLLFVYVGAELGITNWSAEFFVKIFGSSAELGALTVSLFWFGLVAGRLGFPLILPRARTERLLIVLAIFFAISVGLMLASGVAGKAALPLGLVAVAFAGLGASCIYPSAITLVGAAFPAGQSTAIGFAATGGGIGAFVFPFAMSAISGGVGLVAGFAFYAGLTILTAAAAAGLAAVTRRPAK
ncbi:MAG: MFS transporter [Treponema sp.]|nr:MFS transporter [Treponema sp.]